MGYILVVEDDDDIRDCIRDFLEDEGYAVATAAHGAQALEILGEREQPCLMLVDLLMPVMDGVELINRVRETPHLASIPVVAISAASTMHPPPGTPLLKKPVGTAEILAELPALAAEIAAGTFSVDARPRPLADVEQAWADAVTGSGRIVLVP